MYRGKKPKRRLNGHLIDTPYVLSSFSENATEIRIYVRIFTAPNNCANEARGIPQKYPTSKNVPQIQTDKQFFWFP